ncbi:MAG: hypothetical protein V3S31_05555 [Dehalococcoidia bacterium]
MPAPASSLYCFNFPTMYVSVMSPSASIRYPPPPSLCTPVNQTSSTRFSWSTCVGSNADRVSSTATRCVTRSTFEDTVVSLNCSSPQPRRKFSGPMRTGTPNAPTVSQMPRNTTGTPALNVPPLDSCDWWRPPRFRAVIRFGMPSTRRSRASRRADAAPRLKPKIRMRSSG